MEYSLPQIKNFLFFFSKKKKKNEQGQHKAWHIRSPKNMTW
jgi:hypothetical protein